MPVYPSNKPPIGTKLCQNAFRTIPNVSIFDAEKKKSAKFSDQQKKFFAIFVGFWASHGKTDLTMIFYVKFCFRWTYSEVCTTENASRPLPARLGSAQGLKALRP